MDSRRVPRTVSDPKVRQVGFFAPPDRSQSGPLIPYSSSPPVSEISPSGNSLSPVMIPPPRHLSADLSIPRPGNPYPAPLSPLRRDSIPVGSYNPSEFSSPTTTNLPDDTSSPGWHRRGSSGKFATSLPSAGFELPAAKQNSFTASRLTTVSNVNAPMGLSGFSSVLYVNRTLFFFPILLSLIK